jgi:hypothetical protein
MGDHGMGASVEPGIPLDVPGVNAGLVEVATVGFNEKGGDQFRLRRVVQMDKISANPR